MLRYIIKRILVFIPTMVVISLLAFIISINAPGDPVERMVSITQGGGEMSTQTANVQQAKEIWTKKLGLDLPIFYFSLSNIATPDTLFKIYERSERNALERLIADYGNWEDISDYYLKLGKLQRFQVSAELDAKNYPELDRNVVKDALNNSMFEILSLKSAYDNEHISFKFLKLDSLYKKFPFFEPMTTQLALARNSYNNVKEQSKAWKNYVPSIKLYGNNQYHRWVFGDGNIA